MGSLEPFLTVLSKLYPNDSKPDAPRPLQRLLGVRIVRNGESVADVARRLHCRRSALEALVNSKDPVQTLLGCSWSQAGHRHEKSSVTRRSLGQLLLGRLAEQVFETLYKKEIGSSDLVLEDATMQRTDTDYRVLNGQGHPIFRINIKFHGTLFRRSQELVGLAPEDCFALATYKIWQGLRKEEAERLPYVFLVVSTPGLTGEDVGGTIPDEIVRFATLISAARVDGLGKRNIEDRIVRWLIGAAAPAEFRDALQHTVAKLESSEWRALSARKAERLLRDRLFDMGLIRFGRHLPKGEYDVDHDGHEGQADAAELHG